MTAAHRSTSLGSVATSPPTDEVDVRVFVQPTSQSVTIDFGGPDTDLIDRIGDSVYVTFGPHLGELTSIQVFDDPAHRDRAWCDIVRSLAGPTLTERASAALTDHVVFDEMIAVPLAEYRELRATWADLHPQLAERLDAEPPLPAEVRIDHFVRWQRLQTAVTAVPPMMPLQATDQVTSAATVPAGLADRLAIEPMIELWVDDHQLWVRTTAHKPGPAAVLEVRLVEPDTHLWVPVPANTPVPLAWFDEQDADALPNGAMLLIRKR